MSKFSVEVNQFLDKELNRKNIMFFFVFYEDINL